MDQAAVRRWDEGLDGTPRRIAETADSPLRVLAGPGTGKSYALMRRVARLLQEGTVPNRILVCTFTRTAAQDLRKDLGNIGMPEAEDVIAGTIHSICFSILSKNHVLPITGRVPRPLLKYEERFLIEDLNHQEFGGVRAISERLSAFNSAWARRQHEAPGWPLDQQDRIFQAELLRWLQFHQAMLIGELVPETLHFLLNNPLADERTLYDHVLVDEYQDLNRAEQDLVQLLAENGTLTIVGDEDQSIYSFKYAHPEGIAEFGERHPETHDESLDDCRRCPQLVVEMANSLIVNNRNRTGRALNPLLDRPRGDVYLVQWDNLNHEADGIARFIAHHVQRQDVQPGQILVLAPRQKLGKPICDSLLRLGIPSQSFYQDSSLDGNSHDEQESASQRGLSVLALLANPEDRVALRCYCGYGHRNLNYDGWNALRNHCQASGDSPMVALEAQFNGILQIPHIDGIVEKYQLLREQLGLLATLQGHELVDSLFPPDQAWTELFRNIAATIRPEDLVPAKLFESIRTNLTQPELPTDVDFVRVMSLYKSKGLTADMVIITGLIQGLIPTPAGEDLPFNDQRAFDEEQRRLFYVGITRTRQTLVLSSFRQMDAALAHQLQVPLPAQRRRVINTITSPFINELGPNCPRPMSGQQFLLTLG